MDGGHGNINHCAWIAFLRKSNGDKVWMKFEEVDFHVFSNHFTNLRFLLASRQVIILTSDRSKVDVINMRVMIDSDHIT